MPPSSTLTTSELIRLLLPTIQAAASEQSSRLSRKPTSKDLDAASTRAFMTVLEVIE